MSFGFGNTSAFGSATNTSAFGAKPTGFAAPQVSSAAAPTFGLGTGVATPGPTFGAFGTTPVSAPAFGGFGGFGATTTTTASTGFSGFGGFGTAASSAPATGLTFGSTTSTAPGNFSFGSTSTPAPTFGFGAPASTAATGFGGFGGFGTTTSTAGGNLFGGGIGQTSTTGGFGGFGGFGSNVGANAFGAKTNFGSTFGAPQQQQQPVDPNAAFSESILNCQVFGDERDTILQRWNLLQALYGSGKGFYNQQAAPVEYDQSNPLCRFKGIAYNARPTAENKDGCVKIIINKKESELRNLESQIIQCLNSMLGNKPNVTPTIDSIHALSESKSLLELSVQEKAANGSVRKVPAQELAAYLCQPMMKQQLNNLHVENILAQVEPSAEQIREYLSTPPAGVDAQVWNSAQDDNPFPDRLIPVPVVGFTQVRWRLQCQQTEALHQQAVLDSMGEDIAELQRKHTATVANITEYKLRLVDLQHRVLKVILLQEKSRKMGMSLMPEEEGLNSRLESLSAALNSSAFKSRLSALKEAVNSLAESNKEPQRYKMEPTVVADIKQFLNMSQSGISYMVETIQSDVAEVKAIKDGMARIIQRPVL